MRVSAGAPFDAVIVGGGFAGLACARHLQEHGRLAFVLVTREITERTSESPGGEVCYGTLHVNEGYTHCLPYLELGRRVSLQDFYFQGAPLEWLPSPLKANELTAILLLKAYAFRVLRCYRRFKMRAKAISQKEALESDPFLLKLYRTPAAEFVRKRGLDALAARLLGPLVRFNTSLDLDSVSAFIMLGCAGPAFLKTYEFRLRRDRLLSGLEGNIHRGEVTSVRREGKEWIVSSADGSSYCTRNVVLAIPLDAAMGLVRIQEQGNSAVEAYMVHLRGKPRPRYDQGRYVILSPEKDGISIIRGEEGNFLVYSRRLPLALDEYFEAYHIIRTKLWKPALFLGTNLVESDRGEGLMVIGDINFPGLEDSFISGIYAANRLLKGAAGSIA
jgi:hypothetical protein